MTDHLKSSPPGSVSGEERGADFKLEEPIRAARSRLESIYREQQQEIAKLNRGLEVWQEAEASVCPEDWGFVEYIKQLEISFNRAAKELLAAQATLASLKDSQLTAEQARWLMDEWRHDKGCCWTGDCNDCSCIPPEILAKLRALSSKGTEE